MSVATTSPRARLTPELRAGIARRFVQIAAFMLAQAAILFIGAGRMSWGWAWVYLTICVGSISVNATMMLHRCPELIAERGRPGGPTATWDRTIGGLWSLLVFFVLPLVAALDARWRWTADLGTRWHVVGAIGVAAGLGLAEWAILANAYFSTAVRIQSDRGQTVCRTGPYRFVRHPGYAGFILQTIATAVVLGSAWALVPAAAATVLMVIRTSLEDRLLGAKLSGYADYTRDVPSRLLPFIW